MTSKNDSLVYSVNETAEILGIGRNVAYSAVHNGDIPSIRIGRSIKIPKAALDALLENAPAVTAIQEKAQAAQIEILKMPRTVRSAEPKVGINIQITASLNNKLVQSAIAKRITLAEEVRRRLTKSFEQEK